MAAGDLLYQAPVRTVEQIERGRDNLLRSPIYDAGALVAPSSGTVSVYDPSNTAVVNAAVAPIVGSEATYTLLAATTASLSYGEGWRIEWALVMPDGTTRRPARDAVLCRSRLFPPAVAADLFQRYRSLDPSVSTRITALTLADFDGYLDSAWLEIEDKIQRLGRRPWLMYSPQAFRGAHIALTLSRLFADLSTRSNPAWYQLSRDLWAEYQQSWPDLSSSYDSGNSGVPDANAAKTAVQGSVWLGSGGDQVLDPTLMR